MKIVLKRYGLTILYTLVFYITTLLVINYQNYVSPLFFMTLANALLIRTLDDINDYEIDFRLNKAPIKKKYLFILALLLFLISVLTSINICLIENLVFIIFLILVFFSFFHLEILKLFILPLIILLLFIGTKQSADVSFIIYLVVIFGVSLSFFLRRKAK